ncbi:DUF3105 domain-containing protein [Pseudonocardia halophobica]|uniref:DUF3105 domain-containing protein n=1 Tax=Pseudonocardia halophobica TaxID=29401 RepID=A0A9W6P194_9PSEU|nr:DUF3105 domain-containing protein [Pseudonocardia halophobica]GLL15956.1 hypothetical protein GCM10017577_71100 [Pseudonocardia halophobica]
MASGKSSKASRNKARNSVVTQRSTPWGLIAGVLVVVLFAGAIFGYAVYKNNENSAAQDALAAYTPSDTNRDPSAQIAGVVTDNYTGSGQGHVVGPTRVAYTHTPPFGGDHDQYWAACTGIVYPTAVRQENLVHSLEHGAVWIAYNPDQVSGAALDTLSAKVDGQPYTVMAPYPGLDQPISLQAWNHQLKLGDANDPRIDQFITALRRNQYNYPEIGATCQALGPGAFDQDNPPAFEPTPGVAEINGGTIVAERGAGTTGGTMPDPTTGGQ